MNVRAGTSLAVSMMLALAGCEGRTSGGDGGAPQGDGGVPQTDSGTTTPTSPLVDPECTDGMYGEVLPDPDADIADLVGAYDPSTLDAFVIAVLERRYGVGAHLVEGASATQDCIDRFIDDTSTAASVLRALPTVVHECGHMLDNAQSSGAESVYVLTETLSLSCSQGDAVGRGGLTFARNLIIDDEYQSLRPPCGGTFSPGCDFYADIYLNGDPDDGTFDSGDQGFSVLFDEVVQYVNSIATALAITNELSGPGSVSERDGILNFLWYMQRYLRMARLEHPSAYAHLVSGDGGCWREAILTVWGRAWLYLDATAGMGHLGIDDDMLTTLVSDPELLAEIQLLRDAEGCPAP